MSHALRHMLLLRREERLSVCSDFSDRTVYSAPAAGFERKAKLFMMDWVIVGEPPPPEAH